MNELNVCCMLYAVCCVCMCVSGTTVVTLAASRVCHPHSRPRRPRVSVGHVYPLSAPSEPPLRTAHPPAAPSAHRQCRQAHSVDPRQVATEAEEAALPATSIPSTAAAAAVVVEVVVRATLRRCHRARARRGRRVVRRGCRCGSSSRRCGSSRSGNRSRSDCDRRRRWRRSGRCGRRSECPWRVCCASRCSSCKSSASRYGRLAHWLTWCLPWSLLPLSVSTPLSPSLSPFHLSLPPSFPCLLPLPVSTSRLSFPGCIMSDSASL